MNLNSVSSGSSSDESNVSDGSWNAAPTPMEILNGMIEGINSTFQNLTVKAGDSGSSEDTDESYESYDSRE